MIGQADIVALFRRWPGVYVPAGAGPSSTAQGTQAYSSLEVAKNSRGYTWTAKVYVQAGQEDRLLPMVKKIEAEVRAEYGERESE